MCGKIACTFITIITFSSRCYRATVRRGHDCIKCGEVLRVVMDLLELGVYLTRVVMGLLRIGDDLIKVGGYLIRVIGDLLRVGLYLLRRVGYLSRVIWDLPRVGMNLLRIGGPY